MAEHEKRRAARALLSRSGYRAGGHISTHAAKHATKHEIVEAVHEHEGNMHPGKPKTRVRLKDGGLAHGGMAHARGDKKSRSAKGKGHTTVNVVMANHPHPKPVPVPVPMGAGPGGPPPMPPPDGGGGPPPGLAAAGGPPPMQRGGRAGYKKGGAVKVDSQRDKIKGMPDGHFKKGGRTKYPIDDGAGGGLGRIEKAEAYGAPVKKGGRAK